MSVRLEPVGVSETMEEPHISENIDTPPDVTPDVAEQSPDNVAIESESKPTPKPTPPPEPKKRGRPRKEAAAKEPETPKAAPKRAVRMKPPSPASSSGEEGARLTRDDMETMLLDYLVKKKAIATRREKAKVEPTGRAELRATPEF